MKKNRKILKKILLILLKLFLGFIVIMLLNSFITSLVTTDIKTLKNNYEQEKQKFELLEKIPEEVIEEGKGINLHLVPEEIKYRITNDNENIIFYYYIEEKSSSQNEYSSTITLTNDYEILDQIYSNELVDFEVYKKSTKISEVIFSMFISIFITALISLFITLIIEKKKKSDEQGDGPSVQ